MMIEGFYNMVEGASGPKWARRFFPIVMTIFLFIVTSNWLGLTPLFGGWGVLHHSDHGNPVQWVNECETIGLWMPDPEKKAEQAGHTGEESTEAHEASSRKATEKGNGMPWPQCSGQRPPT